MLRERRLVHAFGSTSWATGSWKALRGAPVYIIIIIIIHQHHHHHHYFHHRYHLTPTSENNCQLFTSSIPATGRDKMASRLIVHAHFAIKGVNSKTVKILFFVHIYQSLFLLQSYRNKISFCSFVKSTLAVFSHALFQPQYFRNHSTSNFKDLSFSFLRRGFLGFFKGMEWKREQWIYWRTGEENGERAGISGKVPGLCPSRSLCGEKTWVYLLGLVTEINDKINKDFTLASLQTNRKRFLYCEKLQSCVCCPFFDAYQHSVFRQTILFQVVLIPFCRRLRAGPIFPLEFVEPQKDVANACARKSREGKTRFLPRFPRACVRDVFSLVNELKRKNRDCSQSILPILGFQWLQPAAKAEIRRLFLKAMQCRWTYRLAVGWKHSHYNHWFSVLSSYFHDSSQTLQITVLTFLFEIFHEMSLVQSEVFFLDIIKIDLQNRSENHEP